MSRATSSSSTTAITAYPKSRRRPHLDRDRLNSALEVLTALQAPSALPTFLPLHPEPSGSEPPAPPAKRKFEPDTDEGSSTTSKKPRTSRAAATPRPPAPIPPRAGPSTSHPRYGPAEDGELCEEPPAPRSVPDSAFVPVRRPRRNKNDLDLLGLHNKYQVLGRMFKFSGDRRIASTFSPRNSNYRPLRKPPHPDSPYHKYANILARLELLDGLTCFTYAFWCTDTLRGKPNPADWLTMASFLKHCKGQWPTDVTDDREKALGGLVWLIQGYIHGRIIGLDSEAVLRNQTMHYGQILTMHAAEKEKEMKALAARATPPMLPSPASMTTGSANSTPASRSTPAQKEKDASTPSGDAPKDPKEELPPSHLTVPLNGITLERYRAFSGAVHNAKLALEVAQTGLTLPVLAKHFPRTFARMVHTTYSLPDEHEPDFEDDEGELFWPAQLVTGGGIGWVCHMGRAMVREFGREFGYAGQEGLLSKIGEDGTAGGGESAAGSGGGARSPHLSSAPLPRER